MVQQTNREALRQNADIHTQVPAAKTAHKIDRCFELPPVLYKATVGLFLGFVATMGAGFAHPEMILPVVIFTVFIVAGFGVPMIWTRLAPQTASQPMRWARFQRDGIMTASGHATARDAAVQVLILPVLIFAWGLAAVTIAALVG